LFDVVSIKLLLASILGYILSSFLTFATDFGGYDRIKSEKDLLVLELFHVYYYSCGVLVGTMIISLIDSHILIIFCDELIGYGHGL
jgi:ABC-type multidrug transport system permease subunit